jgi:hypothetical protein
MIATPKYDRLTIFLMHILLADIPLNVSFYQLTRTANVCELFHSRFNKTFYTSHPRTYNCMDTIIELETEIEIEINNADEIYTYKNMAYMIKFQRIKIN